MRTRCESSLHPTNRELSFSATGVHTGVGYATTSIILFYLEYLQSVADTLSATNLKSLTEWEF
jgi:hypothetical protein